MTDVFRLWHRSDWAPTSGRPAERRRASIAYRRDDARPEDGARSVHPILVLFLAFAAMESTLWIVAVRWLCTGKSPRLMRRSLSSRGGAFGLTAIASVGLTLVAISPQPYPWHSFVIAAARKEWTYDGLIVAMGAVGVVSAWCVERWYRRRAGH
jgi:hypothetical protein